MKADIVIIGTGPGGSMAACRLAETGMKVIVLEKSSLPRVKACGGAIPAGMKTFFDWDITPYIENEVSSIKFLNDHSALKESKSTQSALLMVDRSSFDYHLIDQAVSLGKENIELVENFRVSRVEERKNAVFVYGNKKEPIETDFLIAADGAFSRAARSLGLNKNISYGLAMDTRVEITPDIFDYQKNCATFNFFCLSRGYGWIFPKNGYFSCGVGAWHGVKKTTLAKEMNLFLKKSFPPDEIKSIRSMTHPVPIYSGHREIATQRVCLVGDAANLVEPIMGEGIRFALKSGALAADIIACLTGVKTNSNGHLKNISWENGGCRCYQTHIHDGIGSDLDILYRYALPVFLDAPEFFYRKFIMQGHSYLSYFKHISAQLKNR